MTDKINYTTTPRAVVYIKSKNVSGRASGQLIPIPVVEYRLVKTNSQNTDTFNFKCDYQQFPESTFTEMFLADGRSGRFETQVYSNYVDVSKGTFFKNDQGKYEYRQEILDQLKSNTNLRFFGLINSPELNIDGDDYSVQFHAEDLSGYLKSTTVKASYQDMGCVELIEHIASKFGLIDLIDIAPGVSREIKIGDKGSKEGYVYTCKDKSLWGIIQDCAARLGEIVRVQNKKIQIGRFQNKVNSFTYIFGRNLEYNTVSDKSVDNIPTFGPNMRQISFKREPRLSDENIYVEVVCYNHETKERKIGSAGRFAIEFENLVSDDTKSGDNSKEGLNYRRTRVFRIYRENYEGNTDELAEKILNNIVYKRWKLEFDTVGNPYIQPDDRIIVKNFFGGSEFEKIKWYVSKLEETYSVSNGYSTKITCEGVLLDDITGLEREKLFIEKGYSSKIIRGNMNSGVVPYSSVPANKYYQNENGGYDCEADIRESYNPIFKKWDRKYPITSYWGYRTHPIDGKYKFHDGIDYGIKKGTPLKAPYDCIVVATGGQGGYGNTVMVKFKDGYYARYAHMLDNIPVKPGQKIKAGTVVGYVGSTGYSTGAHLHFEIIGTNHKSLDPRTYWGPRS